MSREQNVLVQELGILSKLVYNDKYITKELNEINKSIEDDAKFLVHQYIVKETKDIYNGFQAMLVKNNGGEYTFVFRGTDELIDGFSDVDMSAGNISSQMTATLLFVRNMINEHNINLEDITFTGHSLGGSLANMAGYVYGCDTYAYNAFGIENLTDETFTQYSQDVLIPNGINPVQTTNNITNFFYK